MTYYTLYTIRAISFGRNNKFKLYSERAIMINSPAQNEKWLRTVSEESERFVSLILPTSFLRQVSSSPSPSTSVQTDLIETAEKSVQTDVAIKTGLNQYKGVPCQICDGIFVSQGHYEMHLQYNSSYQCCICKKQFLKIGSVKLHAKVHSESWNENVKKRRRPKVPTKSFSKVKKKREEVEKKCSSIQIECKNTDAASDDGSARIEILSVNSVRGGKKLPTKRRMN